METFLSLLSSTNTKQKLEVGQELLTYLQNDSLIEDHDLASAVGSLVPWIRSSNFKVSQMGLDILSNLISRKKGYFKPHVPTVFPAIVDRLGDSKETVRDKCQALLQGLLEYRILAPQQLLERLAPAFCHKNCHVRNEVMKCLLTIVSVHGADSVSPLKLVPAVVKLLGDPNSQVRDTSIETLVAMYKQVGEKIRHDLVRNCNVAPSKLSVILRKFDELKAGGNPLPTSVGARNVQEETVGKGSPVCTPSSFARTKASGSRETLKGILGVGSVGEEMFLKAFKDVPSIQIFSTGDLNDNVNQAAAIINDTNQDWSKRVEALKKIRSILIACEGQHDAFCLHLRHLNPPFLNSVKDLRSQVVREACVTIAFMSQELKNKLDCFAERIAPQLFNLLQSSAKIMASAGQVAIKFLVRHTQSPRLIPVVCSPLSHKSRDIRRCAAQFLHQILLSWPTGILNRHSALIENSIKSAVTDADQDVRVAARKTYWAFEAHFPLQAEVLLNTLDPAYKRSLFVDKAASSSLKSLSNTPSEQDITVQKEIEPSRTKSLKFESPVNIEVRPAPKVKETPAKYDDSVLPRSNKTSGRAVNPSVNTAERQARHRRRTNIGIDGTPNRTGSLSSRLEHEANDGQSEDHDFSASRTPSCNTSLGRYRNYGSTQPLKRPKHVTVQRVRRLSLETRTSVGTPSRDLTLASVKSLSEPENYTHTGDCETSSVSSEDLFSPLRPHCFGADPNSGPHTKGGDSELMNVSDLLRVLGSTRWSDKKDALMFLSLYLQTGKSLTKHHLLAITENLSHMICSSSHCESFGMVLDTVNELIVAHSADLQSWAYNLLSRLFNRLDVPGSTQAKIQETLIVFRETFGCKFVLLGALNFLAYSSRSAHAKVVCEVLRLIINTSLQCENPSTALPPAPMDSTKDVTTTALAKIIGWAMCSCILKESKVQGTAEAALLALFTMDSPQVSMRLRLLAKEYQEAATVLIEGQRRSSETHTQFSRGSTNPSSQDSGISQMSWNAVTDGIRAMSRDSHMTISSESGYSVVSRPEKPLIVESEDAQRAYTLLMSLKTATGSQRKHEFEQLSILLKLSNCIDIGTHFTQLLHILTAETPIADYETKVLIVTILYEVVYRQCLVERCLSHIKALMLILVHTYGDQKKDIPPLAEQCLTVITSIQPKSLVIKALHGIITKNQFPLNMRAIRILSKVVAAASKEQILPELPQVMPSLVETYGHANSMVRRATVYCLVGLIKAVGMETLNPYLTSLNANKQQLLQLYITKAESK